MPKLGRSGIRRTSSSRAASAVKSAKVARKSSFIDRRTSAPRSSYLKLYAGVRGNRILPNNYDTVLEQTMQVYVAAGSMSVANGNYCDILVNSIVSPFQTTYNINRSATYAPFNGTFTQGYSVVNNPVGTGTLTALYQFYRVNRYKLEVMVQPQSGGDTTQAVIWPFGNDEAFGGGAVAPTLRICGSQNRAVTKTCVANAVQSQNTLKLAATPWEDLGITKAMYEADCIPSVTSYPPTNFQDYVGLFLQEMDGATNGAPMIVNIKLTQAVSFWDLVEQQ